MNEAGGSERALAGRSASIRIKQEGEQMKPLPFWKMSGAGNDFIVLDGRTGNAGRLSRNFLSRVCRRALSVGADGVIVLLKSGKHDFKVKFYNPDGSVSRFCGNGSRCVSRYASLKGIAGKRLTFEGDDGVHAARVEGGRVSVSIPGFKDLRVIPPFTAAGRRWSGAVLDVGVPHYVTEADDIERLDVERFGSILRYHGKFAPAGANVDFIRFEKDGSVTIRTYERGVERETLSCGSGCVAASIYAATKNHFPSPVLLHTRSSADLRVFFSEKKGTISDLFLEGDARVIYRGELCQEALSGFKIRPL